MTELSSLERKIFTNLASSISEEISTGLPAEHTYDDKEISRDDQLGLIVSASCTKARNIGNKLSRTVAIAVTEPDGNCLWSVRYSIPHLPAS